MNELANFLGKTSNRLNQDLCPLPHESILSSLWRFAWRNALSGSHLLRYCKQPPVFPTSSFQSFDKILIDQFESVTGWRLDGAERRCRLVDATWWNGNFRYCPLCLEQGYHSYWHQSLHIETCPIDGARLSITCQHCDKTLPRYGICGGLLDRPYLCVHCSNPICGAWPTVEARLSLHCCAKQLDQVFSRLYDWWVDSGTVRNALLKQLPSSGGKDVSHYPFPYRSFMQQWVLDHSGVTCPFPILTRHTPRLIVLRWTVRLHVDPNWQVTFFQRMCWEGRHRTRALRIYRATLRRLERLVYARRAFTNEEYRRYLMMTSPNSDSLPDDLNLPLLALCAMRRALETYLSLEPSRTPRSLIDPSGMEINPFWHRLRICWRIAFVGIYIDMYWSLVSMRSEAFKFLDPPTYNACSMRQSEERTQDPEFIDFKGSIAFPEVDGISFDSMIRRSQCGVLG